MSKVNITESICSECFTAFLTCGHAIPKSIALVGVGPVVCPTCKEIAKRVKAAEQSLASELENPGGDYYTGLRCGIEDRDITDRYEAVEYGWDQAFSYIESILEDSP